MKKVMPLLVLVSLVNLPSLALGRVLALCSTQDGRLTISVTEYIGLKKSDSRLYAAIKDQDGRYLSSFYADIVTGEDNRYGGVKYVDQATGGASFTLSAAPPSMRGFRLSSKIFVDDEMQCSAYNRQLPGR